MAKTKLMLGLVAVAFIALLMGVLTGCGGGFDDHHDHHSHLPVVQTTPTNCHWVNSTKKQRQHKRINGKWKWVTIKVTTKALVCHH